MARLIVLFMFLVAFSPICLSQPTRIDIELKHSSTPYACFATSCFGGSIEKRVEESRKNAQGICKSWPIGTPGDGLCRSAQEQAAATEQCESICASRARCKQVVIAQNRQEKTCTTAYFLY
jgi:hypothetical protein